MSDGTKLYQSENIAEAYIKYRPTYNSDVFETIVSFCQETGACDFSLAVDLGCGSGLSAVPLTKYFKQVIGLDISEALVARAPKDIPNLSFRVGPAEDLSFLQDDSVDLVTVGTALHWMDREKLYPEVERVLKPGGAFVAYCYSYPMIDEPKAQDVHDSFMYNVLRPYWHDSVRFFLGHYRCFSLPFPGWRRNDGLTMEDHWTMDQFVGYLRSTDATQTYLLANPMDNAMNSIKERLRQVYQDGSDTEEERRMKATWEIFMLMGHKPQA